MIKCSCCGKGLETKHGDTLTGASFNINIKDNTTFSKEFVKKQLGPYKEKFNYNLCFECWFKSMGIKP